MSISDRNAAGIGWHQHGNAWLWGTAAGEGCALCDEADAWLFERARALPVLVQQPTNRPGLTLLAALEQRRAKRRSTKPQGDLF